MTKERSPECGDGGRGNVSEGWEPLASVTGISENISVDTEVCKTNIDIQHMASRFTNSSEAV